MNDNEEDIRRQILDFVASHTGDITSARRWLSRKKISHTGATCQRYMDTGRSVEVLDFVRSRWGEPTQQDRVIPMRENQQDNCMDDDDTYGMPASAMTNATESHHAAEVGGISRMGMFVPTRELVRSMPAGDLVTMLDLWMYESPAELIPGEAQIAAVRDDLEAREDSDSKDVQLAISMCERYLTGM